MRKSTAFCLPAITSLPVRHVTVSLRRDVGKICLLTAFTTNAFPQEYTPTVFDNYTVNFHFQERNISLGLFNTSGQESYDRLRPLTYMQADALIVCFSVVSPSSYVSVRAKWIPEIRVTCPNKPVILVGTQCDLREDAESLARLKEVNMLPITHPQGVALARQINAFTYIECSAKTLDGVGRVFVDAIRAVMLDRDHEEEELRKKKDHCELL